MIKKCDMTHELLSEIRHHFPGKLYHRFDNQTVWNGTNIHPNKKIRCAGFLPEIPKRFDCELRIANYRMLQADRFVRYRLAGTASAEANRQFDAAESQPMDVVGTHIGDRLEVAHDAGFRSRFGFGRGLREMHRHQET